MKARIDSILENKVYPLVRATFTEEAEGSDEDEDEPPLGPLCVYDSIFVRYNGDIARAAGRIGASQPLVGASLDKFVGSLLSYHVFYHADTLLVICSSIKMAEFIL